jgi:hypothetical protein
MNIMGCRNVETVSKKELFDKDIYDASKSVMIYYKGSSDRYDYFVEYDGNNYKAYRVNIGDVNLSQRFQLTEDMNRWVFITVMAR